MQEWKNKNLLSKTRYSFAGLKDAFKEEKAIRNELIALIFYTSLAIYKCHQHCTTIFKVFLICLAPLVVELINTAFELIVDLQFGEVCREEIRMAKDMLSAAVMLTLIISYFSALLLIFSC